MSSICCCCCPERDRPPQAAAQNPNETTQLLRGPQPQQLGESTPKQYHAIDSRAAAGDSRNPSGNPSGSPLQAAAHKANQCAQRDRFEVNQGINSGRNPSHEGGGSPKPASPRSGVGDGTGRRVAFQQSPPRRPSDEGDQLAELIQQHKDSPSQGRDGDLSPHARAPGESSNAGNASPRDVSNASSTQLSSRGDQHKACLIDGAVDISHLM